MSENVISITKISVEEYKKLKNFTIDYGIVQTEFGKVLLGKNDDKICHASFVGDTSSQSLILSELRKGFPNSVLRESQTMESEIGNIFADECKLKLLLKGTEFEMKVWEKLVSLKKGSTCCYEDVAKAIENPKAVRAVANAVAKNRLVFIVPCHRVISKCGGLGNYGYGAECKMKLLKYEKAI